MIAIGEGEFFFLFVTSISVKIRKLTLGLRATPFKDK
jgi:hypothetical protein